jgi:hypothetical protein
VTLLAGADALAVAAEMVLNMDPLYTFNKLLVLSHHNCPVKGDAGAVVFEPLSSR